MIAGVPLYAVSPPMPARGGQSAERVRAALAGSLRQETPGVVVAPAGTALVDDDDAALEVAEGLRGAARQAGAALVFAIDVGPPRPGSIRLFACLGGAPVMWPQIAGRGCPKDLAPRTLHIGSARLVVLVAAEALDPLAARRVEAAGGAEAILILSHGGATVRWAPALARLERQAPIVVAAHHGGVGRAYAMAALAVRWLSLPEEAARAAQTDFALR